jgi:hypothetical protein
MLDASTFLAWGVSIINDIVEHERLLRYKSWCSAGEGEGEGSNGLSGFSGLQGLQGLQTYPTWCWLSRQHLSTPNISMSISKSTSMPMPMPMPMSLSTEARRNVLFQHDANMTLVPLMMSRYNISYMPPYLLEVAANRLSHNRNRLRT